MGAVSKAAFGEHVKAPHFIKYRDAVKGWAEESGAYRATTLFPTEGDWAKQPIK